MKKVFYILSIFLTFISQGIIQSLVEKPMIEINKQESSINFNENFLKYSHLGHARLLSSITWVLTLLESDIDHYNQKNSNSWMFHRFNSIRIFDPLFYENYLYGGQYLSIIKDDISGASFIYDKGLENYPDDFWLNYHAGFHFYFEVGQRAKALKSYEVLSKDKDLGTKAPGLPSIISKMRVENGDLKEAYDGLYVSFSKLKSSNPLKASFQRTLYSIKTKIDLKCLNNKGTNCDPLDFNGNKYIKKRGLYRANQTLFNIYLKHPVNSR